MRRLLPAAVLGATALLLTACAAPAPAADLGPAREWLDTVEEAASDGPGGAGSASMLVGTGQQDEDDDAPDASVRLDYPEGGSAALTRADVQCYGGGTVEVGVTVFSADGASSDVFAGEIPCDEGVHEIALDGSAASGALIQARSDSPTYAYVLLIQELTVGFE